MDASYSSQSEGVLRPDSLHEIDSKTEVTAISTSHGSGSTEIVAPSENVESNLHVTTGSEESRDLPNEAAGESKSNSYSTTTLTTDDDPVLGGTNTHLDPQAGGTAIDEDLDKSHELLDLIKSAIHLAIF